MRNQFAGPCYRCGETVPAGKGYFERNSGRWRVQHAECHYAHVKEVAAEARADMLAGKR